MKKRKKHIYLKNWGNYGLIVCLFVFLIGIETKKEDVIVILTTVLAIIKDVLRRKPYQMLFSNKDMIRITTIEATVLWKIQGLIRHLLTLNSY